MAARLALRRISFLNFATSSTLRPLASTAFPFSSDATRDATAERRADAPQPAPGLSPANVATLDDVTVSASIIETGDVLLSRPRVTNLAEDLSPEVLEEVNRIPSPPEKVKPVIPFPTLAKVQRNTRQEPQLLADAIRLAKANAKAGFTETVEAHVRLGIDPKRSDQVARILGPRGLMPNPKVPPPPCLGHPIFFPVFESKRSMYTDVAAARVGRRPDGVSESHVDALDGIEEMAAGAGSTAKMSIVLKSFEKIHPGRLASVSKVGLPTTRILFTFNRSPHVDKKARDQFEMKTRKHLLVMAMDVGKLREKYNQLKNHNMLGVQLKVNFHCKTRLDMSRIQGHVPEATLVGQGSVAA